MASNAAALEKEEKLKSALWYAIGQFVDEECLEKNLNATPQFIGALTELVYTQIANTSRDLESFAKHAGRNVINADDVLLLSRRNEDLENIMKKCLEEIRAEEGRGAEPAKKARAKPAGRGGRGGRAGKATAGRGKK